MPNLIKPTSAAGITRPFRPQMNENNTDERIAHALEHIAVVLSALDHNFETWAVANVKKGR